MFFSKLEFQFRVQYGVWKEKKQTPTRSLMEFGRMNIKLHLLFVEFILFSKLEFQFSMEFGKKKSKLQPGLNGVWQNKMQTPSPVYGAWYLLNEAKSRFSRYGASYCYNYLQFRKIKSKLQVKFMEFDTVKVNYWRDFPRRAVIRARARANRKLNLEFAFIIWRQRRYFGSLL